MDLFTFLNLFLRIFLTISYANTNSSTKSTWAIMDVCDKKSDVTNDENDEKNLLSYFCGLSDDVLVKVEGFGWNFPSRFLDKLSIFLICFSLVEFSNVASSYMDFTRFMDELFYIFSSVTKVWIVRMEWNWIEEHNYLL